MRKIKTLRVLACLFPAFSISLLICCLVSHAAEKAEKKAPETTDQLVKSDSPIHITADRMESNQEQKIITFEGHVFVQQDDLNITSNHLKVVLLPGDKVEKAPAAGDKVEKAPATGAKVVKASATGDKVENAPATGDKVENAPATGEPTASQKIDYIEFTGDVKVTSKDRLATADKAIFYQKEQKVTLHGHPVVTQGQDRVQGNLITIYLQQSLSIVEGGSGTPVQAVLFPEKKE
ncbi:MAG: LptA/OstA family protein [Syntrophobacteraceae bacterium]